MLAEIYGWFTEGFDIADLKEAKACSTNSAPKRSWRPVEALTSSIVNRLGRGACAAFSEALGEFSGSGNPGRRGFLKN